MGTEIERTFLLDRLPDLIDGVEPTVISQGYLCDDSRSEVRLRARGDDRLLTVKGGTGEVRSERTIGLTRAQFDALWPMTDGRRVVKRRWVVAADGVEYEVDAFDGPLDGLRLVEVEFASTAASRAFRAPSWCGPEVTDDPRYGNAALARDGLPDDHAG